MDTTGLRSSGRLSTRSLNASNFTAVPCSSLRTTPWTTLMGLLAADVDDDGARVRIDLLDLAPERLLRPNPAGTEKQHPHAGQQFLGHPQGPPPGERRTHP